MELLSNYTTGKLGGGVCVNFNCTDSLDNGNTTKACNSGIEQALDV